MAKAIAKKKSNTIKLKFDTTWSYAPAPESKSAASINKQYDLFINGEWQKPSNNRDVLWVNNQKHRLKAQRTSPNLRSILRVQAL